MAERKLILQEEKIDKFVRNRDKFSADSIPVFFNLSSIKDRRSFLHFIRNRRFQHVVDDYEEQLKELYAIENPTRVYTPHFEKEFFSYVSKMGKSRDLWQRGRWVYFPWISTLVHLLPDREFQKVRTARNRYLINEQEQELFYNAVVGVGGLSVGNSVSLSIVLQGGARHLRLADFDSLTLTNTNRVRAGVDNLGLLKVEVTARQIYLINPYAKVEIFSEGLTQKNIRKFLAGPPRLDVMIDELDNLAMKYTVREEARRLRIPVVMGADNGDNAVIDVERYDQNPRTPFFHGRLGRVSYENLRALDKFGIGKTITCHIGPENMSERTQKSLLEMGKTIVSWPQLGGAALLNGLAIAYCVRKIVNKENLAHNRAIISLDEKLVPGYDSLPQKQKRQKIAKHFKKIFGL